MEKKGEKYLRSVCSMHVLPGAFSEWSGQSKNVFELRSGASLLGGRDVFLHKRGHHTALEVILKTHPRGIRPRWR